MAVTPDGVYFMCEHERYGNRVPTHQDVAVMLRAVELIREDDAEEVCAAVTQLIRTYVHQFRTAIDPEAKLARERG